MFAAALPKKYQLKKEIASGGMGHVFLAYQADLDRDVAIKFLEVNKDGGREAFQRFKDEIKVCARLNHPHIVTLLDFDLENEFPYIVFEYIEGKTLKDKVKSQELKKLSDLLDIMAEVAEALDYAHSEGVVHRDIKPENILVTTDGSAKVADFGLAKLGGVTKVKTRSGDVVGTPAYMPPEQIEGKAYTGASDIYSFGAVLFDMAAGTPPFGDKKGADVLDKHLRATPPRLLDVSPKMPELLGHLVEVSLQKEADCRPADVSEVAQALRDIALEVREGGDSVRLPRPGRKLSSTMKKRLPQQPVKVVGPPPVGHKILVAIAIIIPILLGAYAFFAGGAEATISGDVTILANGAKTALVKWSTTWPAKETKAILSVDSGAKEISLTSFSQTEGKEGELSTYEGLLKDLEPEKNYGLALIKPDGTKSLKATLKTLKLEPFKPLSCVALTKDGELTFTVQARVPMTVRFTPEPTVVVPKGAGKKPVYAGRHVATYSLDTLVQNPAISAKVTSIDGDTKREVVDVRKHLLQVFTDAFADFERSREDGDFWVLFNKADQPIGKFFRDNERDYKKLKRNDPSALPKFEKELWASVRTTLKGSRWYTLVEPFIPGLPKLVKSRLCSDEAKEKIAKALLPFSLVDRAAGTHELPRNPDWLPILDPANRPFPLGYGKSFLSGTVSSHKCTADIDLIKRNVYLMFDDKHPKFKKIFGGGVKADLFSAQTWTTSLRQNHIQGVNAGEIELAIRTAIMPSVIVIDINKGKFVTTFEPRMSDVAHYTQWRRDSGANVREVAMMLRGDLKQKGKMQEFLKVIEEGIYQKPKLLYHYIPLSCLYKGNNTIKIYQMSTTIDSLEYIGVTSVKIRLQKGS